MKIRTKIALVFTLMTATILFMLSSFVYVVAARHAREYFTTRLKVRASIAAESHLDEKNKSIQEIRQRHLQKLPREQEFVFKNDSLFVQRIREQLRDVPVGFVEELRTYGIAQANRRFQYFSGIAYPSQSPEWFLIATAYDENAEDHLNFLRNMLITGFSVSCLLVFGVGLIFANKIMQPVAAIISRVHEITSTNLSERLEVSSKKDEIAEMAMTFNNMLDRLETTFELQRNFISNASHELNTPLTSILGEAEVILQAPRDQEEYVSSLRVIQHEAKKLHDVTSSLLKLSNISYEGKKQKIEPMQIDELLMSIKISLDQRMPFNHVRVMVQNIESRPDIYTLVGSSVWMELALVNIIQNSIKYSDNKEVLVTLSVSEKDFFIEISDQGIGIPKEDMQYIFEPFFRGRNTTPYKGHGIGLPLAARIVKLHGGDINIFSKTNAGTKVTLRFPQLNQGLKSDKNFFNHGLMAN